MLCIQPKLYTCINSAQPWVNVIARVQHVQVQYRYFLDHLDQRCNKSMGQSHENKTELKKKTSIFMNEKQNKSDLTALRLFTKFGQLNFRVVTKQCLDYCH